MPGFDKSRFVDVTAKDLDEFTCGICQDIFVDPVFTQCCRQTFCKSCISQWLNQNNVCPNDRKTLTVEDLSSPPRFVINLLNNMKVRCDYHSKGCEIISTIEELPKHIQYCYENPNRLCKTCNLKIIGAEEHNCIENLIIRNSSISNEMEKLKNENKLLMNKYQEQNIEFENLMILNTNIFNENGKLQKQINEIKWSSSEQIQKLQQENGTFKTKVEGLQQEINEIKSSNANLIEVNQIFIQKNQELNTKIELLQNEPHHTTKNIESVAGSSSTVGMLGTRDRIPFGSVSGQVGSKQKPRFPNTLESIVHFGSVPVDSEKRSRLIRRN